MNTVEPIRDKRKLEKMKKLLRESGTRDYCMFVLGINSGLRISDLLKLKVKDVMNEDGKLRDRISITEQKTGKVKDFPISESSGKALREHLSSLKTLEQEACLFPSRKSSEPITRVQAWRILNDIAGRAGISTSTEPIGTHTLRKTFGYHAYKMGMDLSVIQKLLNHSSPGGAYTTNCVTGKTNINNRRFCQWEKQGRKTNLTKFLTNFSKTANQARIS